MILVTTADFLSYCGVNGFFKDLFNPIHFLAATFHVQCAHPRRHALTLLWGDGSEALSFEQVDTCSFIAKVGFKADEDNRRGWAEV